MPDTSGSASRYQYPPDDELVKLVRRVGSVLKASQEIGCSQQALHSYLRRRPKLRAAANAARDEFLLEGQRGRQPGEDPLLPELRRLLKRKTPFTVGELADRLEVPPKRVREALDILRDQGFRVPEDDSGAIALEPVLPDKLNLHRSLLQGNELVIGAISDTHLSSNEEALAELELAYDVFVEKGISEVWHSGDWTCGRGIFSSQDAEIKNHTYETQVAYLERNYPRRDGIVTRGISGNHDVEGEFGRIGANPVSALAHRRDDIEFLGDYSAWINVASDDQPCWVHLLHGKGGMSYAYSYKAQKLVDGYPSGRKPAVLLPGHWHVAGWINQRGVNVVWPGCFEWRSPFLARLGLSPAVGFWILRMTVGDDGSLVRFRPEWHQFFEGRVATPAAA